MIPILKNHQKVLCLTVLERLITTDHSLARSHYWLTRGLLAAEFPPWPSPPLLSQPGSAWLPRWAHVDASLSADAGSTWPSDHQDSPPQVIPQNLPPSSWITRARHDSRQQFRPSQSCRLGPLSADSAEREVWADREKQLRGNLYHNPHTPTYFINGIFQIFFIFENNISHQYFLLVRR